MKKYKLFIIAGIATFVAGCADLFIEKSQAKRQSLFLTPSKSHNLNQLEKLLLMPSQKLALFHTALRALNKTYCRWLKIEQLKMAATPS